MIQEGFIKNILTGIRLWVNQKIEDLSFVVSSHINELNNKLDSKQDTLTAGQNIVITNNTISAVIDAGFDVEVVESFSNLPSPGVANTIYFVPITGGTNPNVYDEYMYINNAYEKIGTTEVDLSNYYNKTEIDTALSGKQATLTAGANINITSNTIKAEGYRYNTTTGAFAEGDRDIDDNGTTRVKSTATGVMSHAEGMNCTASGKFSHAEGGNGTASGNYSHVEGTGNNATQAHTHAEGANTKAGAYASHTEGYLTETGGDYTSNTKTAGTQTGAGAYAHAEGNATIAKGIASHSEGRLTFAKGNQSHAEGNSCVASNSNCHAEGYASKAGGYASHAEGDDCETGGNYSSNTTNPKTPHSRTASAGDYAHAEGLATIAYGINSHAEGQQTFAKGNYTHVEGYGSIALENSAHAEGIRTLVNVSANGSHTEGYECETGGNATSNTKTANPTTNVGAFAHAEGNATIAQGRGSHSEGKLTFAKGNQAHAEGNTTIASGAQTHAEGNLTTATGNNSHAEGVSTVTEGVNSHSEGRYTKTLNNSEHAQGSYNLSHNVTSAFDGNSGNTLHSIGIGTSDNARQNAVEVMQNGDVYIKGVGSYDGVHIKNETGAPAGTVTLQEVINGKQDTMSVITTDLIEALINGVDMSARYLIMSDSQSTRIYRYSNGDEESYVCFSDVYGNFYYIYGGESEDTANRYVLSVDEIDPYIWIKQGGIFVKSSNTASPGINPSTGSIWYRFED